MDLSLTGYHNRPCITALISAYVATFFGARARFEGLPVYEEFYLGESVAVLLDSLVGFLEHVGFEGVHACW